MQQGDWQKAAGIANVAADAHNQNHGPNRQLLGVKQILDSISVILVRPRFPENIGSVARAMKNMGLHRLIVIEGCSPLHRNAYKLASGAEDILERAEEFIELKEAVSGMGYVVGTTSRQRKESTPLLIPRELAEQLIPVSQKNSVGLVFGSEKEGLTNEELWALQPLCPDPFFRVFSLPESGSCSDGGLLRTLSIFGGHLRALYEDGFIRTGGDDDEYRDRE